MHRSRVIPCLLIRGLGLVKTRRFRDPVYIGDPVNAARIFSDKEADEIVVLDIDASREGREPNYGLIAEVAGECFMPMAYGGGLRTIDQIRRVIRSGVEKVVINSAAVDSPDLLAEASRVFGSQAIVAGIDAKRMLLGGYRVMIKSATIETRLSVVQHAKCLADFGAGEIFLNSVDRDGTMGGYDLELIQSVVGRVRTPVVACGGAGTPQHLVDAIRLAGASAVAAGSMFVFHGKHRAVLISYPDEVRHL